jgi:uncharacterized repeat protein (TIGR01451 family)
MLTVGSAFGQDLNLSISADQNPARPNSSVTYTVHVSNSGTSDVTDVEVQVTLPEHIETFSSGANNDPGNVLCPGFSNRCDSSETLTWTVGSLEIGESRILFYRTVITPTAPNTTVTTSSTFSSPSSLSITVDESVIIDNEASVALDIGSNVSPIAPGQEFNVSIDYGSFEYGNGAGFAELRVVIPPELEFVGASGSGTESNGTISWTLGPLPGGLNGSQRITVRSKMGITSGELLEIEAELDPGNATEAPASTTRVLPVHPSESLKVVLSGSGVPTVRNGRSFFTLTASNTSESIIESVSVQFRLPDFIREFGNRTNNDPNNVICPGFGNNCNGGEIMTWTVGDLNPGQARTLFFEAGAIDVALGGVLQRFIGFVTAPGFAEQNPTVNYGFETGPVITASVSTSSAPVAPGSRYEYLITSGVLDFSSGADDASLRFELPDGASFVSATGNATESDGIVTWNYGPLAAGTNIEQVVIVEASSSLTEGSLLESEVKFDSGTFGESAVRSDLITPVAPESDLEFSFTSNDTPFFPGTRSDFELTVSNTGRFALVQSEVKLLLYGNLNQFGSGSTSDPANVFCPGFGAICNSGEVLTWQTGSLEPGESKTLYFETFTFGSGGVINRFRGLANASRGNEQILASDISTDTTPVMSLGLSGVPRPVSRASTYTYQLNYGAYGGRGGASNATMRLLLPEGTTPVSTNGGTINDNAIEWNLGAVGGADGGRRIVEVDIDDTLPEGALLVARASLESGNIGETTQRASFPLTTLDSNPLRLTVTPPEAPVQQGQQVTYDVEIENTGTANIASPNVKVVLSDFLRSFDYQPLLNADCRGFDCDPGEILTWTPTDLTPGQTRTLSFTTNVFSSTQLGDMIRMRLQASGAGAETIYQTVNTTIANGFTIPVELTAFTASTSGESVDLRWSTASETNNAGFDVERSTDGETFTAIGFEPGVGTTEEAQSYRFVDREAPFATTLFYRLRQVDTDGTFEYSPVVEVEVTPSAVALLPVAPNPVSASARLRYELPEATTVRLQVFDLLGRRVATLADGEKPAGRHEVSWQSAGLASGTYFVRLQAGSTAQTQMLRLVR